MALHAGRPAAVDGGVSPDAALDSSRVFEIIVEDPRSLLREFAGRKAKPTAMILDSRTLQSTPESGARAGYDGAKRRKGSKVHTAVDTRGHLLALHVTAATKQDLAQASDWPRRCSASRSNMSIRYRRAKPRPMRPKSTASGWKSSSIQKQNGLRAAASKMGC